MTTDMKTEERDIRQLVEKFMQGATTIDEELALQRYFCGGEDIPADLEPYARMFRYFAEGMPEDEALPQEADSTVSPKDNGKPLPKRIGIRRLVYAAAGAAAAIAALAVMLVGSGDGDTNAPALADAGQTAAAVHTRNTSPAVSPDSLENKATVADTASAPTSGKRRTAPRRSLKYRYKPAPQETFLAQTYAAKADSVDRASRAEAENELRGVETRQRLAIGLIQAAGAIRRGEIELMCREDVY